MRHQRRVAFIALAAAQLPRQLAVELVEAAVGLAASPCVQG